MENPHLTKLLSEEKGNSVDIDQKSKKQSTRWLHVFPDYYEVGMLNIGFQMGYFMLNDRDDIFCERGFLQDNYYNVIFSIPFEMLYTNALKFLGDNGIEPFAERRNRPIVIAGGNGSRRSKERDPNSRVDKLMLSPEADSRINFYLDRLLRVFDDKVVKIDTTHEDIETVDSILINFLRVF